MLETDEKWQNEYLNETLSGNSEIKIELFGVDLGKGLN